MTVPLVWGEKSSEVTGFGAEVVVMSDVVYDPAGGWVTTEVASWQREKHHSAGLHVAAAGFRELEAQCLASKLLEFPHFFVNRRCMPSVEAVCVPTFFREKEAYAWWRIYSAARLAGIESLAAQ